MIYFLTYAFLNRYYRYIAKYLHDTKGYTVNSKFSIFLRQDPGRKQNLPPEGSTSETLMKGPLTEVRAGPKEDKGWGRPRDAQSYRRTRCEWSPLRAEASWGQMQLFHTLYQGGERAWKRSLSLFSSLPQISCRCLPLAKPKRKSTIKGNGVMEAVGDRLSLGSRERKMIWGGVGVEEAPRKPST